MSRLIVVFPTVALLLAACGSGPATAPAPAAGAGAPATAAAAVSRAGTPSGITVNGEPLSAELIQFYAQSRGYDLGDPNQLAMAREQLVTLVALAQVAVKAGALDRAEVELERLNLLSGVSIADGLAGQPALDDARLQALYQEQLARIGTTEYRINHLLFRNRQLAEDAVQLLAAGQPFAQVMANYKSNPEVAEASELPWIHLGRINPQDEALSAAIRDTPVGQSSKATIITPTGWHLIEVLETRPLNPPPFESLKETIRQGEERSRREALVKQIRDAAKVEGL
jgi:peptidyl-prolyl cis-trans isomerase C